MTDQDPRSGVKCFLFDFGNVVGFFDRTITFKRVVEFSDGSIDQALVEAAIHGDGLFVAYEKGEISSEQYIGTTLQQLGIQLPFEVMKEAWSDIITPNMDIIQFLPRLKKASYRLVLGSNNNPMHLEQIQKQFGDWMKPFDRMIFSHEVGVLKPEREFFTLCIAACGCRPESIVFIDDLEENIHSAATMGFRTLQYQRDMKIEEELARMGILLETSLPSQDN